MKRPWFAVPLQVAVIAIMVAGLLSAVDRFDPLFVIACVLAGLPAFLYVRFVGFRGPTVWNEYVFNLHRLQVDKPKFLPPKLHSESEATGSGSADIYTQKFDAQYGESNRRRWQGGSEETTESQRLTTVFDSFVPVLLATIFVCAGWALVIAEPAFLTPDSNSKLIEALRAGFLGAYVFDLQLLVRRYFQNDIKPVTYLSVVERMTIVPILVAIVSTVFPLSMPATIAVSFTIGFFPVLGLRVLHGAAAKALHTLVRSLDNAYPLSDLDGMTIWEEARLLEEGVEDMQRLVTSNVVDLLLRTRIPAGQLVDWIDQACLLLHLEPRTPHSEPQSRKELRKRGIRSATSLEDVFSPPFPMSPEEEAEYRRELRTFLGASVAHMVLQSFSREPNLRLVRAWRSADVGQLAEPVRLKSSDGRRPAGAAASAA
ncbi:MAG TPA: hypothetical protein VHJ78_06195 [Actinomycetota bacterium]|nr:hypothetical protein [Actinomycetota bacterium]